MDTSERTVLYKSAARALEMAQKASCPEAALAHFKLAELYYDRLRQAGSISKAPSGL